MAQPSIRIVKSFTYKGSPRAFSNRYHFIGGAPVGTSNWELFFDAVVLKEKAIFSNFVTITGAIGYGPGSDVPVASKTYTTPGTYVPTGPACPGDCAALVRHATSKRSSKNHPVFVFSYYHSVIRNAAIGSHDLVETGQKNAMTSYSGDWLVGITGGGTTAQRSTPDGFPVVGNLVEQYITHRDFPRN